MASGKPKNKLKSKGKSGKSASSGSKPAKQASKPGHKKVAAPIAKKKGGIVSAIKGALLGKKSAPVPKNGSKSAQTKKVASGKPSAKKALPKAPQKAPQKAKELKPKKADLKATLPQGKAGKTLKAAPVVVAPTPVKASKGKKGKALVSLNGVGVGARASVGYRSIIDESVCREVACEGLSTSGGYCRLHYIKNWKKIKRKELILKEKKLNQYIEELVAKYPDKYIEAIRQDLANDKDFAKVIHDLDLDESVDDFDVENESMDSLIDNIKRDFDDEGDSF